MFPETDNTPANKKKGMTPGRMVWTVFMIIIILGLTLFAYQAFGVGDSWVWIQDILILFLLLALVLLAAALFVGLMVFIRKMRS